MAAGRKARACGVWPRRAPWLAGRAAVGASRAAEVPRKSPTAAHPPAALSAGARQALPWLAARLWLHGSKPGESRLDGRRFPPRLAGGGRWRGLSTLQTAAWGSQVRHPPGSASRALGILTRLSLSPRDPKGPDSGVLLEGGRVRCVPVARSLFPRPSRRDPLAVTGGTDGPWADLPPLLFSWRSPRDLRPRGSLAGASCQEKRFWPWSSRPRLQRWKKSWFVLYQASSHGVARLEFFDCKDGASVADRVATKRLDKKIVRLASCVSIVPAPDCSPKEGLVAFRLETSERTYLFATEPPDAADWVARLCEAAFPHSPGKAAQPATESQEEQTLEMATNTIYLSREEVREFWVTVQKTEASERCQLQGVYLLKASWDSLILAKPPSGQPLYTWPYRLLRRYGRDKVMFSFEAGRRCESGPGNFTFETKQGNEIFHVVEAAIHAQKAQADENRQSSSSLEAETPALAQIQDNMATVLSLASEGPPPERRGPGAPLTPRLSFPPEEKDQAGAPPRGPVLKDPLVLRPGNSLSPCLPLGKPGGPRPPCEDTANVYSEPLDAVKGRAPRPDPLYADPADSRLEGSGATAEAHNPASWLLYEQVGLVSSGTPSGQGHIYDEPEGRAPLPVPAPSAIYDEAHFPCEAWRTQGLASPAGYELPGVGDYAVPTFPPAVGKRPPKPCPAPKPPRSHKQALQNASPGKSGAAPGPDRDRPQLGSGGNCNNNSNSSSHPPGTLPPEPIYSRVRKPASLAQASPTDGTGPEQSVDESRPASVYEDLGEI